MVRVRGELRSSYIIDPPDGQIPHLASPQADFQRRNFGVRYATEASVRIRLPRGQLCDARHTGRRASAGSRSSRAAVTDPDGTLTCCSWIQVTNGYRL